MPIISMQRRLRQAGRIRTGAKVATSNGKSRPSKLESFRFTSSDRTAIEAVADLYGGDVQEWNGAAVGTQWEVFTKATDIEVFVPPVDLAFSQWMEDWSGAVCQKRCDGETNILTDSPCSCDAENPTCKPTTRVSVILTALEGIGVWRLETRGWNGAAELGGAIDVLKAMQSRGAMVPGRLMLEQRQSKRLGDGGKVETFNFAVPVLDFKVSVGALASGDHPPVRAIAASSSVPAPPSVAEQVAHSSESAAPKPRRASSAAPIPSTGLKPKGVTGSDDKTPGGASKASVRKLMAVCRGNDAVGSDDDARHKWAAVSLGRDVASFNDLSQGEVSHLIDVASGKVPPIPEAPMFGTSEEPF